MSHSVSGASWLTIRHLLPTEHHLNATPVSAANGTFYSLLKSSNSLKGTSRKESIHYSSSWSLNKNDNDCKETDANLYVL